jgi:hypothetical protein
MVDLFAPGRAFVHAWESRSSDSAEALKDGTCLISRRLAGSDELNKFENCRDVQVERVDYSPTYPPIQNCEVRPHRDPFVIELNLELDEEKAAEEEKQAKDAEVTKEKKKHLIPLGWMLPRSAMKVMDDELNNRLAPATSCLEEGPAKRGDDWFKDMQTKPLGRLLALLHRERPGNTAMDTLSPSPSPTPKPSIPAPSPTPTATPTPRQTVDTTESPSASPTPGACGKTGPHVKLPICVPRRRLDLRRVR